MEVLFHLLTYGHPEFVPLPGNDHAAVGAQYLDAPVDDGGEVPGRLRVEQLQRGAGKTGEPLSRLRFGCLHGQQLVAARLVELTKRFRLEIDTGLAFALGREGVGDVQADRHHVGDLCAPVVEERVERHLGHALCAVADEKARGDAEGFPGPEYLFAPAPVPCRKLRVRTPPPAFPKGLADSLVPYEPTALYGEIVGVDHPACAVEDPREEHGYLVDGMEPSLGYGRADRRPDLEGRPGRRRAPQLGFKLQGALEGLGSQLSYEVKTPELGGPEFLRLPPTEADGTEDLSAR